MGEKTGIEWTDHTFNGWWGCTQIDPGCDNCYAKEWDKRMGGDHWGDDKPRRMTKEAYWRAPLSWNRKAEEAGVRRRVFAFSMADWAEDRPDLVEPRARLFALIQATPWLDWLLLTKREENLARFLPWGPAHPPAPGLPLEDGVWGKPWPNVWPGVTGATADSARRRAAVLAKVPAVVRFISAEPLLEDIAPALAETMLEPTGRFRGSRDAGTRQIEMRAVMPRPIDWVIMGCESGAEQRPATAAWYRRLIALCRQTGAAPFLKQATRESGPAVYPGTGAHRPELVTIGAGSKVKRDGVVVAPYLDGAQYLEFPTPRAVA